MDPLTIALALGGSAAISAIAQIFEANKAADTLSDASAAAIAAELSMFGIGREALEPFISGGAKSMGLLVGTPHQAAIPAHWKTAAGKDVTRGVNWTPTPAVKAVWKNPQGKLVKMPSTWKPGAGAHGWVMQSPGAQAGHPVHSTWIAPGGQTVNKPWNFKPPAGQEAHWQLKTPGQGPTVGWTKTSEGKAAVKANPGALKDLVAPIVMDQAALEKTPGFQWQNYWGGKAAMNALVPRGLGGPGASGAALKGAIEYAEGLASSNYQQQFANALANKQMAWQALYGTASLGEGAATGVAREASATGEGISANILGSGKAQAGADLATANAITGTANALSTAALLANQKTSTTPPPEQDVR